MAQCNFHIQDTRFMRTSTIEIHTLCVSEVKKPDEFAMFDVAAVKGFEWSPEDVKNTLAEWIPKLRALGFSGLVDIGGMSFPKTRVRI